MKQLMILLYVLTFAGFSFSQTKTLSECIDLALANNPDLQKSAYSLQQSQVSTKQALSSLYPRVSANASTSNSGPVISEMNDRWNQGYGASVNQQFYTAGMYSGIKLAKERQLSTQYSDESLRDQVRTSVERLYFQILASDTLISVYDANIQLADEQIVKMQRMVDLGLKRPSDLLKSKVQRGTFESQLIREIDARASTKRSLNIYMGQQPNAQFDVAPVAVDQIDVPEYKVALAMMLEKNPSLKRYETEIGVQRLSHSISKESYLPSLSGSYSASHQNSVFGGEAGNSDQVSLSLSYNIFNGFARKLNVQNAQINLEEAQLDYEASRRDLDESLSNQYESLDTQNKLIAIHETNLASARKDLEVVTEQYSNGFSTILDLNDSQVSVLESETSLLSDLYTRKQIEAEIKRLIGK